MSSQKRNMRCPQCGTKRFRKSAEGHYICKYGHQLLGWQEETADETVPPTSRLKRKKHKKVIEKNNRKLYGAELRTLTYRIFQYGLRMMARTFVRDIGLPAEFEYVTRELWILYVQDANIVLADQHLFEDEIKPRRRKHSIDDDLDLDLQLASDDEPSSSAPMVMTSATSTDTKSTKSHSLSFQNIITLCYLACRWLRCPVLVSDIRRWCITGKLPYLRLNNSIPESIRLQLDNRDLQNLRVVPNVSGLHRQALQFMQRYEKNCQLVFPEINHPLILARFWHHFVLPPDMYFCAMGLYEMLKEKGYHKRYRWEGESPDVQCMICILIAVKFIYVLNDIDEGDPYYDDNALNPPLPKSTWLKLVTTNAERWHRTIDTSAINSPDIDFGPLIKYIDEFASRQIHYRGRANKKNMLQDYMQRLSRDLGASFSEPSLSSDHDVFLNSYQDLLETVAKPRASTYLAGSKYLWYGVDRKDVFPKEYESVVGFGASILEIEVIELQAHLRNAEKKLYLHARHKGIVQDP
ncbi:uncharacterized protein BYT42DRAFT_601188 [Radiomyces spectabilis]|uniref:uncharacterized protein n=1 Tax=Radiomyces spectabilis TaxID=64574 RepID=UPI00221F3ADC|nr:uncharacterized protein BYT42DRAFT_601188 [Radiomyces spectabilis]KAI8393536.1 hypothetical protein BYT42DRAFT_601188 [Radiomyces spectabilis]